MKDKKLKLVSILIVGFATAPERDWLKEALLSKKEIKKAREENLRHISKLADDILQLLKK